MQNLIHWFQRLNRKKSEPASSKHLYLKPVVYRLYSCRVVSITISADAFCRLSSSFALECLHFLVLISGSRKYCVSSEAQACSRSSTEVKVSNVSTSSSRSSSIASNPVEAASYKYCVALLRVTNDIARE